jgi:hypothetical protein
LVPDLSGKDDRGAHFPDITAQNCESRSAASGLQKLLHEIEMLSRAYFNAGRIFRRYPPQGSVRDGPR